MEPSTAQDVPPNVVIYPSGMNPSARPDTERSNRCAIRIVDLGLPRNVDPAIAEMPGVSLIHLDQLADVAAIQTPTVAAADRIIDEELSRLSRWILRRAAALNGRAMVGNPRRTMTRGRHDQSRFSHPTDSQIEREMAK